MATQVDFYVLAGADVAGKLTYACRIADKAFGQGMKVYVQTEDAAQSQQLDTMLWTFSQNSFVPHIVADGEGCDAERYPVQIGTVAAPPECEDFLITLKCEAPADYTRFTRVAELIADDADDKAAGRNRFRFYRENGVEPKMHEIK